MLYHHTVAFEHRPEVPRGITPAGLEGAVEIGQVVEAAGIADLGNAGGGIHQHAGGVAYAQSL